MEEEKLIEQDCQLCEKTFESGTIDEICPECRAIQKLISKL